MATVTNRTAAPALRGQAALVTLDSSESINKLPSFTIGQACVCSSTSKNGRISAIDVAGHTFEITPLMPIDRFDSTASGYLSASETITIT